MPNHPIVTMVCIGRQGIYDIRNSCYYWGDWMCSMVGKKVCALKDVFLPTTIHCFDAQMNFIGTAKPLARKPFVSNKTLYKAID